MTDIISPSYSFISLSSVKLYPLGLAPFKVSALTGRFISLEICTNQMSLVATCQNVSLARRHERLSGEGDSGEAGFKELQRELRKEWGHGSFLILRLYFIEYLGLDSGWAVRSRVSETSRLTAPESWLLSVAMSSFFACYVHLAGGGQGCRCGEGG